MTSMHPSLDVSSSTWESDFRHFVDVTTYSDLAISPPPDGSTAAFIGNAGGSRQLYLHSIDPYRGEAAGRALPSASPELMPDRVAWSRDASWLLVTADRDGNERYELHAVDRADGTWRPLSSGEARRELGSDPFSPDGRWIVFGSNARCDADFDIAAMDLRSGALRTVLATGDWLMPHRWSPDGRHVVVSRFHLNTDQDLLLLDFDTGEARALTRSARDTKYIPGPWTPDGRGFFVLSDQDREYTGLAYLEVASGELQWLRTPERDVEAVGASRDASRIAWVENERGFSVLYSMQPDGRHVRRHDSLGRGVVWNRNGSLSFGARDATLALLFSSPTTPWSFRQIGLAPADDDRPVSLATDPRVAPRGIEPDLVSYLSADATQIDALLYPPAEGEGDPTHPCVIAIHGGPESQTRPEYDGLYQYLAHRGIGVLAPNVRGSTGYGRTFQVQIHRDFGGCDLMDLAASLRFLVGVEWVDPDRIGVYGASYGGFAALSCIARIDHPWAAAVSLVAPLDLVAFTRDVPPWWRRVMKRWMGDPDEDAALLRERSPTSHVDSIRAPLLLIHGSNDSRVRHRQSEAIAERLRTLGRTVEYVAFADEGHRFSKNENLFRVLRASADWLALHLGVERANRP